MGSKADFYIGRGIGSEWLGSLEWDGLPAALPPEILNTTTEEVYRTSVNTLLTTRGDGVAASDGWPWPWDTSQGTKYTYTYDPGLKCVLVSCYGSSWWIASKTEPDHTTLKRRVAIFPNMAMVNKGRSVFVVEPETKKRKSP